MRLAIFGGTGQTGQHLVRQALNAGHQVVILVCTPTKVTIKDNKLTIVQGDVQNAQCVEDTVRAADAVLSVLGPTNNRPEFAISKGTTNILNAMKRHNVRRMIISAGAGVRDPQDRPKIIDHIFGVLLRVLSKNAVADMKQVVDLVRSSDRDWVIVRVPKLTDQPAQRTLKIGYVGDITTQLSREDMAAFMLQQLQSDTYLRKAPAISN